MHFTKNERHMLKILDWNKIFLYLTSNVRSKNSKYQNTYIIWLYSILLI